MMKNLAGNQNHNDDDVISAVGDIVDQHNEIFAIGIQWNKFVNGKVSVGG